MKTFPEQEINQTIGNIILIITKILQPVTAETMGKEYPEKVFDDPMTTEYFLLHLLAHLNYHLEQINYHQRITG